jgi:hypothetical protein
VKAAIVSYAAQMDHSAMQLIASSSAGDLV